MVTSQKVFSFDFICFSTVWMQKINIWCFFIITKFTTSIITSDNLLFLKATYLFSIFFIHTRKHKTKNIEIFLSFYDMLTKTQPLALHAHSVLTHCNWVEQTSQIHGISSEFVNYGSNRCVLTQFPDKLAFYNYSILLKKSQLLVGTFCCYSHVVLWICLSFKIKT